MSDCVLLTAGVWLWEGHLQQPLDMLMKGKHQERMLHPADASPSSLHGRNLTSCLHHILARFLVRPSLILAVCVAKWTLGSLKDVYIKVAKCLVRVADSGIIKWIIHARKIDGFAAEACNKLLTFRGSEIQTKLRVNLKKKKKKSCNIGKTK